LNKSFPGTQICFSFHSAFSCYSFSGSTHSPSPPTQRVQICPASFLTSGLCLRPTNIQDCPETFKIVFYISRAWIYITFFKFLPWWINFTGNNFSLVLIWIYLTTIYLSNSNSCSLYILYRKILRIITS
jgi:hypothetical protein